MLSLLIDENFNQRILRGLKRVIPHLDYVVVPSEGLRGAEDPELLARAAEQGRVLLTHDLKTVPKHAYERIKNGASMSGVVAVPNTMPIGQAIDDLSVLAECATPDELQNRILYLPL